LAVDDDAVVPRFAAVTTLATLVAFWTAASVIATVLLERAAERRVAPLVFTTASGRTAPPTDRTAPLFVWTDTIARIDAVILFWEQ
jgi:hypothetical protein